ncbi:MAG TPA: DUF4097 family beta strand repeat-containing protein [Ilumatobacter sp.]|nr:DUF4097 family beta strand repeat-containing protein [Ilumatobacter sp.]
MTSEERFVVGDRPDLTVELMAGSVDVRVGDPGEIKVVVGGNADLWEIDQVGDAVTVRPRSRWRGRSARMTIDVPRGAGVEIRTASADVTLAGELGVTRVRTASGNVRAAEVAELDVSTASGDIRVHGVGNDTSAASVSGALEVTEIGGRLAATTASGDVRVRRLMGDLEIGTTSGDVRIDHFGGSSASIRSVSGDVELGLPSGIRVEPDLTTVSGRTRLPDRATPTAGNPTEPRRTVRLLVKTVSGDITLGRIG